MDGNVSILFPGRVEPWKSCLFSLQAPCLSLHLQSFLHPVFLRTCHSNCFQLVNSHAVKCSALILSFTLSPISVSLVFLRFSQSLKKKRWRRSLKLYKREWEGRDWKGMSDSSEHFPPLPVAVHSTSDTWLNCLFLFFLIVIHNPLLIVPVFFHPRLSFLSPKHISLHCIRWIWIFFIVSCPLFSVQFKWNEKLERLQSWGRKKLFCSFY